MGDKQGEEGGLVLSPFLTQVHHLQAVGIATLDPLDALQLWVYEEWPALTWRNGHTHARTHTCMHKCVITLPSPQDLSNRILEWNYDHSQLVRIVAF